jgi:predicted amidohydrolase
MARLVQAAVIQIRPPPAATIEQFQQQLKPLVEQAAQHRAKLVALPLKPAATERLSYLEPPRPTLLTSGLAKLARSHSLCLAAGPVIIPFDGRLYNTAFLFGPDGTMVGTQRQTHLSAQERGQGLARSDTLEVFDTEAGRIGLVVGEDVRYPEVSRILCLQGANVLVHAVAATTWSQAEWMARLWREVQANQVFGLEAALVGDDLHGRSTIHAPVEMTPDRNGVLAMTRSETESEVIAAMLDFDALQKVVDEYPIYAMLNYAMYRRYFPEVYRR